MKNKENHQKPISKEVTFDSNKWLVGEEIEFAFEEIEENYPNRHAFIPPHEFVLSKHNSDWNATPRLLSELANRDKELVFIPINNANHENAYQGNHWSLLVYKTKNNKFYHLDSTKQKINWEHIEDIVKHFCEHKDNATFKELNNIPLQTNGDDCGIYLITFTKLLSENPELLEIGLPEINSTCERECWRELVNQSKSDSTNNNINSNEVRSSRSSSINYTRNEILEYAKLAKDCYNSYESEEISRRGWELILCSKCQLDVYYKLYINKKKKEVVLGVRGTDPNNLLHLWNDYRLALKNILPTSDSSQREPFGVNELRMASIYLKNYVLNRSENGKTLITQQGLQSELIDLLANMHELVIPNLIESINLPASYILGNENDAIIEKLSELSNNKLRRALGNECFENSVKSLRKNLDKLMKENYGGYDLKLVGHSLGGIIAELCSLSLDLECISFESTGTEGILNGLKEKEKDNKIVGFLSAPNIINTLYGHSGKICRLKIPHIGESWSENIWLLRQHTIGNFEIYLQDDESNERVVEMISWPQLDGISNWKSIREAVELTSIHFSPHNLSTQERIKKEKDIEKKIKEMNKYTEKQGDFLFMEEQGLN